MAAYAALISLMNTVEQIQNHPHHSFSLDNEQINSLREKVGFLQDFIENGGGEEAEILESQIASAAHAAEDVIESHLVDRIRAVSTDRVVTTLDFLRDLQKKIEDMDPIMENIMEKREFGNQQPTYSIPASSSRPLATGKNTMVGFNEELIQLMELLTGQQSNRQIISIVGMGGIGKTTLASNVFENPLIVQYFDIRAWAKISPNYSVREILLELLSFTIMRSVEHEPDDKLGEMLYKRLSGRRYLIILDDLWSVEDWNKIKLFFPDNGTRSRVVITTRLSNVATHFGSLSLSMNFLDEDRSWSLFREKAIGQEGCPPELEEIGKEIVKKCNGLPLSIVVIGGFLGRSYRSQEYWENISKDINPLLNLGEDELCLNILSLSYGRLPAHLKPCFLYSGIFPENYDIRVSQLVKLWVSEGFVRPNRAQSLEEVAEGYLQDLIDRNLILIRRWGLSGKIRTCYIHDLLRNLCLRIAEKEKFLCVMGVLDIPQSIKRERRIVLDEPFILKKYLYHSRVFHDSKSTVRSLICSGVRPPFKLRLLRVLTVIGPDSLEDIFQQVNLRYLAFKPFLMISTNIPSLISLLWNVQTLIIRGGLDAPPEIWEMPQLRHVQMDSISLPDPPPTDQQDVFVMGNLQTLLKVINFKLSEDVSKRVPNLKKLGMKYMDVFERLHFLESPTSTFARKIKSVDRQNLRFPSSLQKLTLEGCWLQWEDLTMIGSLPHLEVLKLGTDSVRGRTWNSVEGQFLRLRYLKIDHYTDLIYWDADTYHFPVLENLVLRGLYKLHEIPPGIGETPTLRFISLRECSKRAAVSAARILHGQEDLGNEGLQVRVQFWAEKKLESFKEKVELENLTSNNLKALLLE